MFPDERIEVTGAGRNAVSGNCGGPQALKGGRDKSHSQGFRAFVDACRRVGACPVGWEYLRSVSWAPISARENLRTGYAVSDEA